MYKIVYLILFSIFTTNLLSQSVVYFNIDPDTSIEISSGSPIHYDLDMNQDGTMDFRFIVTTFANSFGGFTSTSILPFDSNRVMGDSSSILQAFEEIRGDSVTTGLTYHQGEAIFNSMSFSGSITTFNGHWQNYGPPKYCGVKFYGDSTWYYAWILLNVESSVSHGKITIYEFGYSETPLAAGDGSPPVSLDNDFTQQRLEIYPNPTNSFFFLKVDQSEIGKHFTIRNSLGNEVVNGIVIENTMCLPTNHLEGGIYSLEVGNGTPIKFIVIK